MQQERNFFPWNRWLQAGAISRNRRSKYYAVIEQDQRQQEVGVGRAEVDPEKAVNRPASGFAAASTQR